MRKTRRKSNQDRYDEEQYYEDYADPRDVSAGIERVRRKLLRLMVVSIIITILLVGAVLVAVIYKITRPAGQGEAAPAAETDAPAAAEQKEGTAVTGEIILPAGTRLLSQSISGRLISLETLLPGGGTELIVYDYQARRIVARLRIPVSEMKTDNEETQSTDAGEE